MKVSKNTQKNFPYNTESVSQHLDNFNPKKILEKKVGKKLIIFREGEVGGGGLPLCGKFFKDNQSNFSSFPLLGVTISRDLTWSAHAHERSSKEALGFGEIFKALWEQNNSSFQYTN